MLLTMAGILLPAAEFDTLPAIVATVDGHAVTRDAVVARLKNSGKLSPEGGPAAMRAAARQAAETEVYFFLLGRLLATENITPSEEAAARHLAELERLLPHGLPTRESGEKARIAASENYRWNVALQEFLRRAAPEVIAVSDAEIEQVYRLNQDQFRLPEQYQFGVIRIPKSRADARETAETGPRPPAAGRGFRPGRSRDQPVRSGALRNGPARTPEAGRPGSARRQHQQTP